MEQSGDLLRISTSTSSKCWGSPCLVLDSWPAASTPPKDATDQPACASEAVEARAAVPAPEISALGIPAGSGLRHSQKGPPGESSDIRPTCAPGRGSARRPAGGLDRPRGREESSLAACRQPFRRARLRLHGRPGGAQGRSRGRRRASPRGLQRGSRTMPMATAQPLVTANRATARHSAGALRDPGPSQGPVPGGGRSCPLRVMGTAP